MVRGKNNCGWLMLSRKENCGKRCVGELCARHNYQLKTVKKRPVPCRSCGAGVVCDYRLCLACGGSNLKHWLIRKQKSEEKLRAGLGGAQAQAIRELTPRII